MTELKSKENFNWLLHLHYVRGEYDLFEKQLNLIKVNSSYSWYLRGLIVLRRTGNVKEGLKYFTHITQSTNGPIYHDVSHIKAIARCLLLLGQHNQVCEIVRDTGLRLYPNDWQLCHMLGECYLHLGNISSAKDAFQRAIQNSNQLSNNHVSPFLLLAQCFTIEGDQKAAISILRKASEIMPDNHSIAIRLGQIMMNSELRLKGIEKFLQLAQMTTSVHGNLELSLAIGSILQEYRGDIDGALNRYRMCETFESPSIWNNVGLCFAARKKYVAAISCLKRALYLSPLDSIINYNLGLINLQLRQFTSAFHFLKTSCSYSKPSSNIFSLIAVCLQYLDDDLNSRQAHTAAVKSSSLYPSPLAIINYAIYLYNSSQHQNKWNNDGNNLNANDRSDNIAVRNQSEEMITELMMELEQIWLKKKQSDEDIDGSIMRAASKLTSLLNISHRMAWNRKDLVISATPSNRSNQGELMMPIPSTITSSTTTTTKTTTTESSSEESPNIQALENQPDSIDQSLITVNRTSTQPPTVQTTTTINTGTNDILDSNEV